MKAGEVVLVRFPFADREAAKKRPALVLAETTRSGRNRLITVAMITSQVEALQLEGDVSLGDWDKAGLLHPSLLRMANSALNSALLKKAAGTRHIASLSRAPRGGRARRGQGQVVWPCSCRDVPEGGRDQAARVRGWAEGAWLAA